MATINTDYSSFGYLAVGAPQAEIGSTPSVKIDFTSSPPAAGDLLYAWVCWNNTSITSATAAAPKSVKVTDGWTLVRPDSLYGIQVRFMVFVKVSDGTETLFELDLAADPAPQRAGWVGGVFSIAASSYGQMDTAVSHGSASTPSIPSVDAVNDCVEVAMLVGVSGSGIVAAPSGWTQLGSTAAVDLPGATVALIGTAVYREVTAGATPTDSWSLVSGEYTSAAWTIPAASGRAVPAIGGANVGDAMGGSEEAYGYILRPDQTNPSPGSYTDPRYGAKAPGQPYRRGRRS